MVFDDVDGLTSYKSDVATGNKSPMEISVMQPPRTNFVRIGLTLLIGSTLFPISSTLAQSPLEKKPLAVGQKAIDFELPIVGKDDFVNLEDEYDQGPIVIVFLRGYPGHQSALCSQQVSSLSNRARSIGKFAERVILVYPGARNELTRRAKDFLGSKRLPEPLVMVRDDGLQTVDAWGLRWNQPRETTYPATYVINKNGRVAWSKISTSHAGRSTVEEILSALKKL